MKGNYLSLLYAFQTILGLLQLVDVLQVEYVLMTHRVTEYVTFKLPFDLVIILIIMFFTWSFISVSKRNLKVFLFPVASVLVYPVLGIEGTVSVASLLAVAGSLWFSRDL